MFVFHGTDRVTGQRITNVTLTPTSSRTSSTAAATRCRSRATGNAEDNDIVDLNPGVSFKGQPPGVRPARRRGRHARAHVVDARGRAGRVEGRAAVGRGPSVGATGGPPRPSTTRRPTDRMPDGLQGPGAAGQLINGPDNLGLLLAGKGSLGDPPDLNLMGYLDSSTARFYGLPTVCLQLDPSWRTTHTPCVAATPENIAKGLARRDPQRRRHGHADFTPADPTAYPIVDVSYLVADVNQATRGEGHDVEEPADLRGRRRARSPLCSRPATRRCPPDLVATTTTAAAARSPGPILRRPRRRIRRPVASAPVTASRRPACSAVASAAPVRRRRRCGQRRAPKKARRRCEAIADIHYPKAGNRLSGRASWWVVFALTALCLAGLLAHPTVRQIAPVPVRRRPPGRDPPPAVTS